MTEFTFEDPRQLDAVFQRHDGKGRLRGGDHFVIPAVTPVKTGAVSSQNNSLLDAVFQRHDGTDRFRGGDGSVGQTPVPPHVTVESLQFPRGAIAIA